MPAEWLYETAARWDLELAAVEAVVEDRATTVRLVAEPGPAGSDAVRTATTAFALRGLSVDALVASRVLPGATNDTWLAALAAQQRKALDEWRETYDLHEVPHLGHDPRGTGDLAALPVPGVNKTPPRSSGPSSTSWPTTACSSGTSRSSARYARNWTSCGAATNSSSRPDSSAGSCHCRRPCAAARWPARRSARAS